MFDKLIGKKGKYDQIFFCDTETTGLLDYNTEGHLNTQCIEVAAVVVGLNDEGSLVELNKMDEFVSLPAGETLDPKIVELTHITDEILSTQGKAEKDVAQMIADMIPDPKRTLFCSHNVNFDIRYLEELMWKTTGSTYPIGAMDALDTLTVATDRKRWRSKDDGHRLAHLIKFYGLEDKVVNSHRAIDDTLALVEVAKAMYDDRADFDQYINYIGYYTKYGIQQPQPERFTFVPMNIRYAMCPYERVGASNTLPYNYEHPEAHDASGKAVKPVSQRNGTIALPKSPKLWEYLHSIGYDAEKLSAVVNFSRKSMRDVRTMKDAGKFIDRVAQAVRLNEEITIYGDYDCDGVSGSAIAVRALRLMGAKPNAFINHRFNEGYGLNVKGMERLHELYPKTSLIVTLDNGISAREGIAWAKDHGIDVVVSDHHPLAAGLTLPDCPVVDEWREDEDVNARECICGAELIRRLLREVAIDLGIADDIKVELNKLVSLSGCATIADAVPMTPANHYVAKLGLKQMGEHALACWYGVNGRPNEDVPAYEYGPMINACSRMTGSSDLALRFLLTDDVEEAKWYGSKLKDLNNERKKLTEKYVKLAEEEIEENGWYTDSCIVYKNEELPDGIAGLVAARIVETYNVPALCLTKDGGSGRSLAGINIKEALEQCMDLLEKFGGHAMACGVASSEPDELRRRLCEIIPHVDPEALKKPTFITVPEITIQLAQEIESLAPYGNGFERPEWEVVDEVSDYRVIGKEQNHSSFLLGNKKDCVKCVHFYHLHDGEPKLDVVGRISLNRWQGVDTVQIVAENACAA